MKTVSFTVTDEDYERMRHQSVTVDVFGFVRWTRDNETLRIPHPDVGEISVWAGADVVGEVH